MTKTAILFTKAMIFDGSGAGLFPGEVLVEEGEAASGRGGARHGADPRATAPGDVVDAANGATLDARG